MATNNRSEIKDFSGQILGYIIDEGSGNQRATDFFGQVLGYYKSATDFTTDRLGIILARGNILASLIQDSKRNKGR